MLAVAPVATVVRLDMRFGRLLRAGMAIVYIRKDERDKAAPLLKEAQGMHAGDAQGRAGLGQEMLKKRLLAMAQREMGSSIKSDAKDVAAVMRMAARYNRLGEYRDAEELLVPVIAENPNSAMLSVQLGAAYHEQGNWTKAKEAFETAIALSKNAGPAAQIAREQLKTITGGR